MRIKKETMMYLIADWCVKHGIESSTNGNHIIYTGEIMEYFDVERKWVQKNIKEICEYIDMHDEVLDETIIEYDSKGNLENISIMFCGYALCEKCGCQNSEHCRCCEVAHPIEWDEEKLEEKIPRCRMDEIASKSLHALIETEPIEAEIYFREELDLTDEERKYFEIPTPTELYEDEDVYDCFSYDYYGYDDDIRDCLDCPDDECTGHCASCNYRPVQEGKL